MTLLLLGGFELALVHESDVGGVVGFVLFFLEVEASLGQSVFGLVLLLVHNEIARAMVDEFIFDAFVILFIADEAGLIVPSAGFADHILYFGGLLQFGSVCCVFRDFGFILIG